jgi:hypothetical protein
MNFFQGQVAGWGRAVIEAASKLGISHRAQQVTLV